MKMLIANVLTAIGRTRGLGGVARRFLRGYRDGSVTKIKTGIARGMNWRRFHKFSNGYWLGQYEVDTQWCLKEQLKAGDRVFDIGANAGFFVAVCSRLVGTEGFVLAVEPFPEFADRVRDLIKLNTLTHVSLVQAAVSDAEGSEMMTTCLGSKQKLQSQENSPQASIAVAVTTLDRLAEEFGDPDLVLMDIEGQEANAVRGGLSLLRRARPTLIIETHFHKESKGFLISEQLRDLLKPIGYELHNIDGSPATAEQKDGPGLLPDRLLALHPARAISARSNSGPSEAGAA